MYVEQDLVLNLDCPKEVLLERLGKRAATSSQQRSDDDPEIMNKRIEDFNKVTKEGINFYNRIGKVRNIDCSGSPEDVYQLVEKALKPNLIFVQGPTFVGKSVLAKRMASHMCYAYMNVCDWFNMCKLTTCEAKVKGLIKFMDFCKYQNFVLDGFPQTRKQAKIFMEHYCQPLKIVHLHLDKDEVYNRMNSSCLSDKDLSQKRKQFAEFLEGKDELLTYLATYKTYTKISGLDDESLIFNQSMEGLQPKVLMAYTHENPELSEKFIAAVETEKGYVHLDYEQLLLDEISRKTELGALIQKSNGDNYAESYMLLRRIFYSHPSANNQFIISNFPANSRFMNTFSEDVCKFDYFMYMTATPGNSIENRTNNFDERLCEMIGEFHSKKKLIQVGSESLETFDFYCNKRNKYGMMVGTQACGKTTIANALKLDCGLTVIQYEGYHEELCKKLSTDDNPVETLPLPDVQKHLNKQMNSAPDSTTFLLDGFKQEEGELEKAFEALGCPQFVLKLKVTIETLTERYKQKAEITELSEEDNENIKRIQGVGDGLCAVVDQVTGDSQYSRVYEVDVTLNLMDTLEQTKAIFKNRIFIVRNLSCGIDHELLMNRMAFLSCRFGYQFVNCKDFYKNREKGCMVDLQGSVNSIKQQVDSSKTMTRYALKTIHIKMFTRNIVLFEYLQADKTHDQVYPTARDEIFFLNQSVGI